MSNKITSSYTINQTQAARLQILVDQTGYSKNRLVGLLIENATIQPVTRPEPVAVLSSTTTGAMQPSPN